MEADLEQIEAYLRAFAFEKLFRQELGWDHLKQTPRGELLYPFMPLVQKEGLKVYVCELGNEEIANDKTLKQIDKSLDDDAWKHLTIYIDGKKEQQAWLWVKREEGKPNIPYIYRYHISQRGTLLVQKLAALAIGLEEEEKTDHMAILERMQAFETEKARTKKFFKRFTDERRDFLKAIDGISDQDDLEWYTTIMLSRLMFVYFIQKKGLLGLQGSNHLDGKLDYLRERLAAIQATHGGKSSSSFYQDFLFPLFHEGLNKRQRTPQLEKKIGKVPYLNSGLFDIHELEQKYPHIRIPDKAFEQLFKFFGTFDWHVEDRPLRNDREINPDILGYIFEQHVNNKSQGAYYTKEDITGYICRNTIIPFLFSEVKENHPSYFTPDSWVWALLRDNPDEYIYDDVAWGVDEPLQREIEAGIENISLRSILWNRAAPKEFTRREETWREVIARHRHYDECRAKIVAGKITSIEDLITDNLDICKFAEHVIRTCEVPELLLSFYTALEEMTILDPTCGSGAFLFAALNILKPLYQACLQRMREICTRMYCASMEQSTSHKTSMERLHAILKKVDQHHSQKFFIVKSIIIHNLYGVDILKEAVEICKLRLFLKLAAYIEKLQEIEPLPDVDFNVLAGNTLIGFKDVCQVRQVVTNNLFGKEIQGEALAHIEKQTQEIEWLEHTFLHMQLERESYTDQQISKHKRDLRAAQAEMRTELNKYLASDYGINQHNIPRPEEYQRQYAQWLKDYQPFHWLLEFNGIVRKGGFKVIIGNPPFVEYTTKKFSYKVRDLQTRSCANIYPFIIERSCQLLSAEGYHGMILPLAAFATKNMTPLIQHFTSSFPQSWLSFYHYRPAMLFFGASKVANIPMCIYLARAAGAPQRFSTAINKWSAQQRDKLFVGISYAKLEVDVPIDPHNRHYYPKFSSALENTIMKKILEHGCIDQYLSMIPNQNTMFYRSAGGLYWKVFINFPWPYTTTSNKSCSFHDLYDRDIFVALFNSSLFWWYYSVTFDTFNLKDYMLFHFHFSYPEDSDYIHKLKVLCGHLMDDYQRHAKHLRRKATGSYTIYANESKKIIDEIDVVLAKIYGFSDEELDFIINYDSQYRLGKEGEKLKAKYTHKQPSPTVQPSLPARIIQHELWS